MSQPERVGDILARVVPTREAVIGAWKAFSRHARTCPQCEIVRRKLAADPAADRIGASLGCCDAGRRLVEDWEESIHQAVEAWSRARKAR